MRIVAPPGVYRPRFDTQMLIDAVRGHSLPPRARVLELCTGSGAVAIDLAGRGHEVTAVDLGRRAAWAARINALLNRQRVAVHRGDLFAAV
ncbi:MAG: methyltransferase, partial [Solirubrobacteraceae bacterium]|nr:methyltransferase [Solirubrobacteraceae bacterium]